MSIDSKQKFAVIGAGNLAWSLVPQLQTVGEVVQVISRSEEKREKFSQTYGIQHADKDVQALNEEADVVFLTVNDSAIRPLAEQVPQTAAILLHCSGSVPLTALSAWGENIGVWYPLQTFTMDKISILKEVPVFLEGSEKVLARLKPWTDQLSHRIQYLDSEARLRLHLGAVFTCNFTNYLYRIANELTGTEIDFSLYEPLVREQLDKVFTFSPQNTQTGPAIRGDMVTIRKHVDLLEERPKIETLYRDLSKRINPQLDI